MTPRDEQRVRDYFLATSAVDRSTFGGLLERSEQFGFGSSGRPIPAKQRHRHYVPIKSQRSEAAYEPDDRVLQLLGEVSRRLRRMSRAAYATFCAYYGDMGVHWGVAAIYPLTEAGRELLARGEPLERPVDAFIRCAQAGAKTVDRMRVQALRLLGEAKREWDAASS